MVDYYPYQIEAIDRMIGMSGFGLFDEMGLGKTYQALGELEETVWDKVLIVAPKSVHGVWEDAIKVSLLGISFPVVAVSGSNKKPVETFTKGILIVNSEALRLIPKLTKIKWDYVIADEAHVFKNRKAQRTRALKRIKATHKRALTGTPIVNRPDEYWSLLHWLYPKDFGSYWRFFEEYVSYTTEPQYGYKIITGPKNVAKLQEITAPFVIRRLKKDVLKELPDKYYSEVRVELTAPQRKAYDAMKKTSLAWLEQFPSDQPLPAPTVLAQLTRLRQFATAYAQINYDAESVHEKTFVRLSEPSSKLDALMDILDGTDQSVVVFSQFKQLVNLATERFRVAGISYRELTGDTSQERRKTAVDDFQAGKVQVFICTTAAGGVGITLHKASTAVFLDRSFSPAMNSQAEDRLHRIGQPNAVEIILIQANKTVDQLVESKLKLKAEWIKQILG